jgi:hypothetical protein
VIRPLAGWAAVGGLYGWALAAVPLPEPSQSVFWVSNLASPWLVLGFLAGRAQRSAARAAATAVLTEVTGLMGFYSHFLVLHTGDPAAPPRTLLPRIVGNLEGWFAFVAPWLPAAIAAGVVYGLLGQAWRRSRPLVAGLALAVPFVLEPWAWRLHTGFWEPPIALWFVETAVGLALLAGAAALAHSSDRSPDHALLR